MVDQRQALAFYALLDDGLRRAQAQEASGLAISRPQPAGAPGDPEETLSFTAEFLAANHQLTLELFDVDNAEAGALLQALRTLQANRRARRIEVCLRHAVEATVEVVSAGLRGSGFERAGTPGRWAWQGPEPATFEGL